MKSEILRKNAAEKYTGDLNDLTSGYYMLYCSNATNAPENSSSGMLISLANLTAGKAFQIYQSYAGTVWTRAYNWNWTEWRQVSQTN
jgi:hypothetical protein